MCSFLTSGGVIPLQEQVLSAWDLKVEITHKFEACHKETHLKVGCRLILMLLLKYELLWMKRNYECGVFKH
jgi:hypothetical protein